MRTGIYQIKELTLAIIDRNTILPRQRERAREREGERERGRENILPLFCWSQMLDMQYQGYKYTSKAYKYALMSGFAKWW